MTFTFDLVGEFRLPRSKQSKIKQLIIIFVSSVFLVSCTSGSSQSDSDEQLSQELSEGSAQTTGADDLSNDLANEELGNAGIDDSKKTAPDSGANDFAIPNEPQSGPRAAAPPAEAPSNSTSKPEPKSEEKFSGNYSEVSISDIRYVAKKSGGTVVVETSAPATYHTREVPAQSQVVIEVANAQLPERLRRPYVTKDFNQAISSVNAYQDKGSSTVRVVVQFRSPTHAEVVRDGRELRLTAAEGVGEIEDNPTLGVARNSSQKNVDGGSDSGSDSGGNSGSDSDSGSGSASNDSRALPSLSTDRMVTENLKFYGKPISIEVRDTAVRDVINLIADQSGANIVISGDVDGTISLKLRQVPWDQALHVVMRSRNLGYVRQGSILRVAPFESLQKETDAAKRVVDSRKAAEPLRVKIIPVGYAKVMDLEKQVTAFLTPVRGKIVGDPRTNSLVVTDTPDVLERIANLVKALDLPPLQVLIEGKVIEARETFARNFGVRWGFSGNSVDIGKQTFNHGLDMMNLQVPTTGLYNFRVGQFDLFGDINATIGLAESEDQVKVVSSPRIVAVNNEQATIVQATNIPTTTLTQSGGVSTTSVAYTPIEMKLEVTPQVTSENDVIMQIKINRDFAGQRAAGVTPDINKREAKTKVLVRNGQTAVIGGVYQSDMDDTEKGIPWLRNIPVVGWLFKNKAINNEKSELLVFLTPRILNAETSVQKESTL